MKNLVIILCFLLLGFNGFGQIITEDNDTIIIGSNEYNSMINKLKHPVMDSSIYFKYKDFPSVDSVFYLKEYENNKFIHDGWIILETPSKKGNLKRVNLPSDSLPIKVTHYLGIHRFYFPSDEPKKKISKVLEASNDINGKKKEIIYDKDGVQIQMINWTENNKIEIYEVFKPNLYTTDFKNIKGLNNAQVVTFRNGQLKRIEKYNEYSKKYSKSGSF